MACEPIDREPNESETTSAPIDRGWSADRSAKALQAARRRFPSVWGSEFPPKLGQTLCSINRTQFGRKEKTFDTEKTQENTEKKIEHSSEQKDSRRSSIFRVFLYSYFFISSSLLILCLPWILEFIIRCIWLWEANSLILGEIGWTRCWFFSIISNKFLQYSVFMLVILVGLFYLLL